jgi:hypothetical protein
MVSPTFRVVLLWRGVEMLDLFFTPLSSLFLSVWMDWFATAGIVFRIAPRVVTSVVNTRLPKDEGPMRRRI